MDKRRRILYITYDGLTDPLGQSQILAYLKRLSDSANLIVILSYEKKDLYQRTGSKIKRIIDEHKLVWVPVFYTKTPPIISTLYDLGKGYNISRNLHRRYKFQIVHCRGYISAILGKRLKRKGLKFIFDMRGWWADEKLESGNWKNIIFKPVYRYFKKKEKEFFATCDFAVSLTHKGKTEIISKQLASEDKVGVIPTCVDFDVFKRPDEVFKAKKRSELGIRDDEKVFVYSGSVEGNYDPDILIKAFLSFKKVFRNSYLLVLSKYHFEEHMRQNFLSKGIDRFAIYNLPFTEVTNYLRACDVGFIFYKISFSAIGRSPTKLGEYWASGLPVIAFKGIGDLDYIFNQYARGGILLSQNKDNWSKEIETLEFDNSLVLREYSLDYFHIDKGVTFYRNIYNSLIPYPISDGVR